MRVSLPFFRKQSTDSREQPRTAFGIRRLVTNPKGFTLLELLVVTAIVAILLLVVLARLNLFGRQVDLDTTAQQIISTLQAARTQTVASEDESGYGSVYGVHFEINKYVLFKGSVYDSLDPENKEYTLSSVEIYEINLAGGVSDVVFTRIRGSTDDTGNIRIRLTVDTSRTRTIVINSLGQASIEEAVSPVGTRATDTRHLHFTSCPSLIGYTNLVLDFSSPPDPNVTRTILLGLSPGQTVFSWEGDTDVYGSKQTIKFHTHYLDDSGSILSIHRDRMKNNKAVTISIDSTIVVSYTVDGDATRGPFCDVMEAQQ